MDNIDVHVLRTLVDWLAAGKQAQLFTVVRTWGSSPRPPGALMALSEDGAVVGSVSGGCVEDDLRARFAAPADPPLPSLCTRPACELLTYGVTSDEAHRLGLPCGGTLELLMERAPDLPSLRCLLKRLSAGELVQRRVSIRSGKTSLATTGVPADVALHGDVLYQTFGPAYRMLLIGAGQLGEYLATMALFNGFAVTVCDPRAEYQDGWQVSGVTHLTAMPDDAVIAFRPDRRTAIIALSHDPKLDDLALIDALRSDAMYVGAIGSRRNTVSRRGRLGEHFGLCARALDRLRAPIGLYIGSRTPSEIAVSIMAEVLAVKNGVTLPRSLDVTDAKDALEAQL